MYNKIVRWIWFTEIVAKEKEEQEEQSPSLMLLNHLQSTAQNHGHLESVVIQEREEQQIYWMNVRITFRQHRGIYTHRRSISWIISRPRASPCSSIKYSLTHDTRWSLKVPLMTWWSKSGHNSMWMSARGNSHVNGYHTVRIRTGVLKYSAHHHITSYPKIIPQYPRFEGID